MIGAWWADLSGRERVLIGAACALSLALALSQLVYAPLIRGHARAADAYARSMRDLAQVEADAAALTLRRANGAQEAGPIDVRAVVATSAAAAGVGLTRTQPIEGGVSVVIDAVSTQTLFGWLIVLKNEHGVVARSAAIGRVDRTGLLRASLTLAGEEEAR